MPSQTVWTFWRTGTCSIFQQSTHYSPSSSPQPRHYDYIILIPLIGTGHGKTAWDETDGMRKQTTSVCRKKLFIPSELQSALCIQHISNVTGNDSVVQEVFLKEQRAIV